MAKKLRAWMGVVLVYGLAMGAEAFASAESDAEADAFEAAQIWLQLVDEGRYSESWDSAAISFQTSVGQQEWENLLKVVRAPLGKVIARAMTSTEYKKSLPGAPDGEYVVIQYKTAFETKTAAVETVIPKREFDGRWGISGYYIK